jgi:hypothetical protein
MPQDSDSDRYPPKEAEERLQAALRGARIAGHRPMKAKVKAKSSKPVVKPPRK